MGCSQSSKKKTDQFQSQQLPSQITSKLIEGDEVEREIFNQFCLEKYKIQKNPIVQRRAHSAKPSLINDENQQEAQNSFVQRQFS
ncbi:unnamed protein product (macronuclear) [Paramecium tetraurelia]|uniref:Uncharacterized protein n=1 Tax=Paramecium tetraurelia TaxID=5888 RepID=A0BEE0_PARTE|nr:uncharacterized protein GSPATT00027940001 [Paramecium tetraurelia]CAK56907.1 unnamed protein product [Paramecium tetraurelia]|eukprot:XP_001424305.1 hypothetical protein (macronuclear) [Paramecium tetraurelia strain d4-2]